MCRRVKCSRWGRNAFKSLPAPRKGFCNNPAYCIFVYPKIFKPRPCSPLLSVGSLKCLANVSEPAPESDYKHDDDSL